MFSSSRRITTMTILFPQTSSCLYRQHYSQTSQNDEQPSKRMVQWICELTEYSPDIRRIHGSTNTAANALSCQYHKGNEPNGNNVT